MRVPALVLAVLVAAAVAPARGAPEAPVAPPVFVLGVPDDSGLRTLLLDETRTAHADAAAFFGHSLADPVTVAWADGADAFRRVTGRSPGPIAGMAFPPQGRIVLYAPALQSRPDRIVSVLRHEMWHLLFHRATARATVAPPHWLDEGIATWRSGEWELDYDLVRDRDVLRDAAAAGSLFRFEELEVRFPEGARLSLAYAQSASFVEWLAGRAGEDRIRDLLAALDRDLDPDPAFRAVWGRGLADLEEEWRRQARPGGLSALLPSVGTLGVWAGVVLGVLVVSTYLRKRRRMAALPDDAPEGPEPPGAG